MSWHFFRVAINNKYVIFHAMSYTITYYSEAVKTEIMALPETLQARYVALSYRMMDVGANLGEPHT